MKGVLMKLSSVLKGLHGGCIINLEKSSEL